MFRSFTYFYINLVVLVFMDSQVDLGSCKKSKVIPFCSNWCRLTVKEIAAFVQVDLKVGHLDVELKVLFH